MNLKDLNKIKLPKKIKISASLFTILIIFTGLFLDNQINVDNFFEPQSETEDENSNLYQVTKVIDGDTIKIDFNNDSNIVDEKTVRLIAINTPETNHPTKTVECFGQEATEKMKELVGGKNISLEFDPKKGELDKYGRMLAYVFVETDSLNKIFVNEFLIREGYAYEESYGVNYKYQELFENAQSDAEKFERGFWAENVCQ